MSDRYLGTLGSHVQDVTFALRLFNSHKNELMTEHSHVE